MVSPNEIFIATMILYKTTKAVVCSPDGDVVFFNIVIGGLPGDKFVPLAQRLECSPMARETWVQSQVESYQRL